jgi:hypothetical protein
MDSDHEMEYSPQDSHRGHQNPGQPVRRTTPIYQNYGEAYTSITGGTTGSGFQCSTPNTDSLNNVYARAMAADLQAAQASDNPIMSTDSSMQRNVRVDRQNIASAATVRTPVVFPFEHMPVEDDEYMRVETPDSLLGDNPAGMHITSEDLPLRPVLQNVHRGSVTTVSTPLHEPSIGRLDQDVSGTRIQAASVPFRNQQRDSSYPALTSDSSVVGSTVEDIFDQYATTQPSPVPIQDQVWNLRRISTQESLYAISEADISNEDNSSGLERIVADGDRAEARPIERRLRPVRAYRDLSRLSTSLPTYGATSDLLGIAASRAYERGESPSHGPNPFRSSIAAGVERDLDDTSSQHSDDLEMVARPRSRRMMLTEAGTHGTDSSPAVFRGEEDFADYPIGLAVSSSDFDGLKINRQYQDSATLASEANDEDDGAWETTQGSRTQRNSAVPDVDLPKMPSNTSLARQATSTWDPLSLRRANMQEHEREWHELVQPATTNVRSDANLEGATYGSAPESSIARRPISSHNLPSGLEQFTTHTTLSSTSNINPFLARSETNNPFIAPRATRPRRRLPYTTTTTTTAAQNDDQNMADRIMEYERLIALYGTHTNLQRMTGFDANTCTEPRAAESPPRRFHPDARLTIDRRIVEAERDGAFVKRQHQLTRLLTASSVLLYFVGGFLVINSMTENGPLARYVLLQLSVRDGQTPIANVHEDDVVLARRIENFMVFAVGVCAVGVLAVVVALLLGEL